MMTRRDILKTAALASLLKADDATTDAPGPQLPPTAKRVIYLFQSGAPSQIDLFDHKPRLAKLHGDFLDDPTTTDVITFEGQPGFGVAGEVCVSADTAAAYAKKHRRDFSHELMLYLVHGWLHLAGYDDLRPAKKRAMRRAEARAMKLLHAAKAMPRFVLRR